MRKQPISQRRMLRVSAGAAALTMPGAAFLACLDESMAGPDGDEDTTTPAAGRSVLPIPLLRCPCHG